MEKKYILGLDVSTTNIGFSRFEDFGNFGKLREITLYKPNIKADTELETLKVNADIFVKTLLDKYGELHITKIIIEAPLQNSRTQKTTKKLEIFNEYLSSELNKAFVNTEVDHITVYNSRKYGLPELMGKNKPKSKTETLFGHFPYKIAGMKRSEWTKYIIMYLIGQRYPNNVWLLNNAQKINKTNFDRADSVVVALGYMIMQGHWSVMGDASYWPTAKLDRDSCLEIIEKIIAYNIYSKEFINKKGYKAAEKKKLKLKYLEEQFKIQDYLNVKLD